MNDTRPSVIELIAKVTSHASDELKPEMDLIADLGVDSTKALQLLVEIEDNLGVEISDDEAETLNTVSDVCTIVEQRAAAS
ncbi:MAG: acyl carrier protein [Planctomycetota bacterium]